MDIKIFLEKLDGLLHESRLEEAESFLENSLEIAESEGDRACALTIYNELIGFCRDTGKFELMMKYCGEMLSAAKEYGIEGTPQYAAALLNAANACRAAGRHKESFEMYQKVSDMLTTAVPENDPLKASYYNNLSLLYQETEDWESACECLEKALAITETWENGELQTAISSANLAATLIRLDRIEEADKLLIRADGIFKGRSPSDFHYSAALAAMGDSAFKKKDHVKAAEYYEAALSEIELHMGRNNFYEIVSANLDKAYGELGGRPKLSGMELCLKYWKAFGEPMLERNFPEYTDRIAAGLAGEGSECLGYDDEISADHDFGAGFCIWLTDEVYDKIGHKLQKAYDLLPKRYMGIERIVTDKGRMRVGVCRISDHFRRLIGLPCAPRTEEEWLSIDEPMLRAAVSGKVFRDPEGVFSKIRSDIRYYPEEVRLRRLAQQTAVMAQTGQYNYMRAICRGDFATAAMTIARFAESSMNAVHLLSGVYAPYYKWLIRSTGELPEMAEFASKIKKMLCTDITDTEKIRSVAEDICDEVRAEMIRQRIADTEESYMQEYAEQAAEKAREIEMRSPVVEEIFRLEWEAFDKVQNEGGRADCQDDLETFSIMRKSQYLAWDIELLERYREEFMQAVSDGRNLITEKYARMMESTAPEKYAELKEKLPQISPETAQMREAIISIQVGWMEELAERFPNLAANARTIRTESDTPFNTSYETYLRGELMTYSDDLLYMYGRYVVSLAGRGKNLAELIMTNTVHFYGYASLEAAERSASQ